MSNTMTSLEKRKRRYTINTIYIYLYIEVVVIIEGYTSCNRTIVENYIIILPIIIHVFEVLLLDINMRHVFRLSIKVFEFFGLVVGSMVKYDINAF
jgi:hypothetical protein